MAQAQTTATEQAEGVESPYLSVVLPAYNEAANLRQLIPDIVHVCEELGEASEIIIVDDGSTDRTLDAAREAVELYDAVTAVALQGNYGQSAALAAGFDAARGEIIIPMDADGQNDPTDIPVLLAAIENGADVVSGWRRDRDDPLAKRIPSRIQTTLAKRLGPDIHDYGCTLTAYRSDAIDELDLRGERHRYIPAQLAHLGYDVEERVVEHHPREHGESHYGLGRLLRGFVDLCYHLFRVRYRARPMHIFGGLGLLLFALGVGLGAILVAGKYIGGWSLLTHMPALLLSVTLGLFGSGMFAVGLVTELLTELLYRDTQPYRVAQVID